VSRSFFASSPKSGVSASALSVAILGLLLASCSPSSEKAEPESPAPAEAAVPPADAPPAAMPDTASAAPVETAAPTPSATPPATTPAPAPKTTPATTPPPARPAPVQTAGLPAGAGRDTTQRVCSTCHSIDVVTARGRTGGEWGDIINQMTNLGLNTSDAELDEIQAYLTRALPPR
jgi:cytochrome c5